MFDMMLWITALVRGKHCNRSGSYKPHTPLITATIKQYTGFPLRQTWKQNEQHIINIQHHDTLSFNPNPNPKL